jgi:hypothetical protein
MKSQAFDEARTPCSKSTRLPTRPPTAWERKWGEEQLPAGRLDVFLITTFWDRPTDDGIVILTGFVESVQIGSLTPKKWFSWLQFVSPLLSAIVWGLLRGFGRTTTSPVLDRGRSDYQFFVAIEQRTVSEHGRMWSHTKEKLEA